MRNRTGDKISYIKVLKKSFYKGTYSVLL